MAEADSPGRPTADAITAVVADRVRCLRSASGMSQAQLAKKMVAVGVRWTRATVGNLERRSSASRATGAESGRDSISVQELLALAVALKVSVPWLLIDPAADVTVPIAAGVEPDQWSTLLWLLGRVPLDDHPGAHWTEAAEVIDAAWQVATLVERFRVQRGHTEITTAALPDTTDSDRLDEDERRVLRGLAGPLRRVQNWKFPLPALPADLLARASELGVELPGMEG